MYKKKMICVAVPAHNEESQISKVIRTMPEYVDAIVVIDDASSDGTIDVVTSEMENSSRVHLITHSANQGVGGAIVSGYKWAIEHEMEVTAVMAGDGQMDPEDLVRIVDPVVNGEVHYSKGNRLFFGDAWKMIPHYRYLGNSFLSLMTKISSGYWHVADSQSGFTAISLTALKRIDLDTIYKNYGMPNDLLIKLNQYDFKVCDVNIKPVYNVGEKSGIRLNKVIPRISWLLFKGFWRRLFFKYIIRDFHPLIFFYSLSFFLLIISAPLAIRLFYIWITKNDIPDMNALALCFTLISGLQTAFFGMWFDMENNKRNQN